MLLQDTHRRYVRESIALSRMQVKNMLSPLDVIRVLNAAKVSFVLAGAHGLAGWLKKPRATQDVDLVVMDRHIRKATQVLLAAFPHLEADEEEVVVRLRDRNTREVLIDLIKQRALYRSVFKHVVRMTEGSETFRVPSLEMALAMKFAAMVSPNRPAQKAYQDAHDFIGMAIENLDTDDETLIELGEIVYGGGGEALLDMLRKARAGERLEL